MQTLSFEFNVVKLGQVLAFFASSIDDLDKLKAAKLLYFADKEHLVKYGRPIVGDKYYCMDYGPVPTVTLNILSDLIAPQRIRIGGKEIGHPMRHAVEEFVRVVRDSNAKYPRLSAKKTPDQLDALTGSEVEVLTNIVKTYGRFRAGKLIDIGHQERPWRMSNEGRPEGSSVEIPWEYLIEDARDNAEPIREHASEHQENRAFFSALRAELHR